MESKVRKWERGISDPCRGLIVWPEQTSDPLLFETTLYGNNVTRVYDDKEWILMVEELTRKGKHLPIGAVNLNMRLFIEVIIVNFLKSKISIFCNRYLVALICNYSRNKFLKL